MFSHHIVLTNDQGSSKQNKSPNEYINGFHSPFVIKCQKGNEKEHEVYLLIIILGGVLGGVLIFFRVRVLAVVEGRIFLGLLFLIKDLLATWRSMAGRSRSAVTRRASLATSSGKWCMCSCNGGLIGGVPLSERIIKLR